jgi:hypothetical protein
VVDCAGHEPSNNLRGWPTLRPSRLAELLIAHSSQKVDPLEVELGKVYLAAARSGIEFSLNTPAESAKIRADIESAHARSPRASRT